MRVTERNFNVFCAKIVTSFDSAGGSPVDHRIGGNYAFRPAFGKLSRLLWPLLMGLAEDRGPVSTYGDALMWLVRFWADDWQLFLNADKLPPEALFLIDTFWCNESTFRRDVSKICRELDRCAYPPKVRPSRRYGRGVF